MVKPLPPEWCADPALLSTLEHGAKLTLGNAVELYNEALLLRSNGAFARAYALHQMSAEECGKVDMLGATAVGHLAGQPVHIPQLMRRLSHHRVRTFRGAPGGPEAPSEPRCDVHRYLDDHKTASVYVDLRAGRFSAPSELITEALALEMQRMNTLCLHHADLMLRLLYKVVHYPAATAASLHRLAPFIDAVTDVESERFSDAVQAFIEAIEQQRTETRA